MSSAAKGRVFKLYGGRAALDLVNTLDWRFRESGEEELLETYDDVIRFAEQTELLTAKIARQLLRTTDERTGERVLAAVRELREALAEVFYAALDRRRPSAAALAKLEEAIKAARERQGLRWSGSRASWGWVDAESKPELPLWQMALSAEQLMSSEALSAVRACGDPGCRWLFLDMSKNHTRRWCSMETCGNRMKARRFKAQHAAD
jgi:predicted RNA-binding Zn ribbon-like protein